MFVLELVYTNLYTVENLKFSLHCLYFHDKKMQHENGLR